MAEKKGKLENTQQSTFYKIDEIQNETMTVPEVYSLYYQMMNDPQIMLGINAIKSTILSANWSIVTDNKDVNDFLTENLIKRLKIKKLFNEILDFIGYGVYFVEPIYQYDKTLGKIILNNLMLLDPPSVSNFVFNEEKPYDIKEIEFWGYRETFKLPLDKIIIFSYRDDFWNSRGLLKSCYNNWNEKYNLYKYLNKIIVKNILGYPRAKLKQGYKLENEADPKYRQIVNMLDQIKKGKEGYIVEPFWYDLSDYGGEQKQPANLLGYIEYHDRAILKVFLASFLTLSVDTSAGAYGLANSFIPYFNNSCELISDIMCGIINEKIIKPLVEYNFGENITAELTITNIGKTLTSQNISYLSTLIEKGLITIDEKDQQQIREAIGLTNTVVVPKEVEEKEFSETPESKKEKLYKLWLENYRKHYMDTANEYNISIEHVPLDEEEVKRKINKMVEDGDIEDEDSYLIMLSLVQKQSKEFAKKLFFADYDFQVISIEGPDDDRTCPLCSFLHHKYFLLSDLIKLNLITPLHFNCRCELKGYKLTEVNEKDIIRLEEIPDDIKRYHTLYY